MYLRARGSEIDKLMAKRGEPTKEKIRKNYKRKKITIK